MQLYILNLTYKDGMPGVQWDVFFSEVPGHSDGAGGTELLPKDMIADLTPETLIDWLSKEWGEFCNMKQFITDERVVIWCRQTRARAELAEKPDTGEL